jgi:hypothetical protein
MIEKEGAYIELVHPTTPGWSWWCAWTDCAAMANALVDSSLRCAVA